MSRAQDITTNTLAQGSGRVNYGELISKAGEVRDGQLARLKDRNLSALEFDREQLKIDSDHDRLVYDIRQKQQFNQEQSDRDCRSRAEKAYYKAQEF